MKAATLFAARPLVLDYLELTKPRLTSFVLFVVCAGGILASGGAPDLVLLLHAVVGTALVAGGGSALNMAIERRYDRLMPRTWARPIPSGRLPARDVVIFGCALALLGLVELGLGTNLVAAVVAAISCATYLGVYTPLKRRTSLNTQIGAVPGALPALIGWAAMTGELPREAWCLFLIVYLWQIPHFLSIAWIYRDDYLRGGYKMLPVVDPDGGATGRQALVGAMTLWPASLLPTLWGSAGVVYFAGAFVCGAGFLVCAVLFAMRRSRGRARRLLRASLLYLPLVLTFLLLDAGS